jgi:hypothetical protein
MILMTPTASNLVETTVQGFLAYLAVVEAVLAIAWITATVDLRFAAAVAPATECHKCLWV